MNQTLEKKKKRPNSKGKGNGFENKIAKMLTESLAPLNFIRTQGSGARVGGKNFQSIGQLFGEDALKLFVGDVVPVNEKDAGIRFKFSVETKFYKTPDNFTSLVSGSANIFKWMNEAIDDAKKVEKEPLLIFKWNNTPIFVAYLNRSMTIQPELELTRGGLTIYFNVIDELLADAAFWTEKIT